MTFAALQMPPRTPIVPRWATEPPHDELPAGSWAERLREQFLAACSGIDTGGEEIGEPGEIRWFPDRTWHGRTYVPATASTSNGYELLGYVRYLPEGEDGEPSELVAWADFTDETAERNPGWKLDLADSVIGRWRGEGADVAAMTLVWGAAMTPGGTVATAELGKATVDQCTLIEDRFTLIAPDDYRGDFLEVRLYDARGRELARESLYGDEE